MIQQLYKNYDIIYRYDRNKILPQVIKVGILPFFIENGVTKFKLMKPVSEDKRLGEPRFQIAKGTRRINISGKWCDMRDDDLVYADESFHEPLIDTALREGMEEIGLKSSNIKQLFDMGDFTFVSASRGVRKPLHMFAAEMIDSIDFDEFEKTTAATAWVTLEEFSAIGREDHISIVREILAKL